MSFWDDIEAPSTGEFSTGGGKFELIPDNTDVLAAPDAVAWQEHEGDRYIEIRWSIMAPEAYKNRKIFQKVQVLNADQKKAQKAKQMLAAIDFNVGGHLVKLKREPNDVDLARALLNKSMILKLMTWEMNGKFGNWVSAVAPAKSKAIAEPAPNQAETEENYDDSDILW